MLLTCPLVIWYIISTKTFPKGEYKMKLTFKQMLINEIEKHPRGYAEKLAEIAGYANGGNLLKILKEDKKEFDKFNGFVKLIRYVFPTQELEIMESYAKTLDGKTKTARNMVDYLSCHRLLETMKELINKMLVCGNKESVEWAKVYLIQYEWQMNYHYIDIDAHYKKVRDIKVTTPEMKVYKKLLHCYCYYYKDNHKAAQELMCEVELDLDTITNDYIKNVYKSKLSEVLSYINLWVLNKPEEARENALTVLKGKIGLTYDAYAHFIIGYSNLFTSYDAALESLNESVKIYKQIGRKEAAENSTMMIEKLNVFWDKDMKNHLFVSKQVKIWYRAKKGLEIEGVINNGKEIYQPFVTLSKGIKENNSDLLMQSMIQFLKHGDAFQARIPMLELLNRGYSELVLNELISIHSK